MTARIEAFAVAARLAAEGAAREDLAAHDDLDRSPQPDPTAPAPAAAAAAAPSRAHEDVLALGRVPVRAQVSVSTRQSWAARSAGRVPAAVVLGRVSAVTRASLDLVREHERLTNLFLRHQEALALDDELGAPSGADYCVTPSLTAAAPSMPQPVVTDADGALAIDLEPAPIYITAGPCP